MNEETWKKTTLSDSFECEYIPGKGLRVQWDAASKEEALHFISQL